MQYIHAFLFSAQGLQVAGCWGRFDASINRSCANKFAVHVHESRLQKHAIILKYCPNPNPNPNPNCSRLLDFECQAAPAQLKAGRFGFGFGFELGFGFG